MNSSRGPGLKGPASIFLFVWYSLTPSPLLAQTSGPAAPPQALTLGEAIQYADDHYPAVKAAVEQVNASAAGVDVARTAYLPRLDSVWQSNRATANNLFGQLLPQAVLPSISGPVLPAAVVGLVVGVR